MDPRTRQREVEDMIGRGVRDEGEEWCGCASGLPACPLLAALSFSSPIRWSLWHL